MELPKLILNFVLTAYRTITYPLVYLLFFLFYLYSKIRINDSNVLKPPLDITILNFLLFIAYAILQLNDYEQFYTDYDYHFRDTLD